MAKRITRAEWDAMWLALGKDWYFQDGPDEDEDVYFADGTADESLFEDAFLAWQGQGDPTAVEPYIKKSDNGSVGVLTAIRRWRKLQTTVSLVIEYDKSKMTEEAALRALKAAGFRVT